MSGVRAPMIALFVLCFSIGSGAESYASFDGASASSVYSSGKFSPEQALTAGSGYWCSSGNHAAGQSVTWTGALDVRRKALGVKLNWAYAPGEYKILVSSDGGNFEEAACWRRASRSDVSYEETVLFKHVLSAKAITIVMKAPMPWGYFGLNDVSVLTAGDEAFMIVNGAVPHSGGEQCLAVSGHGVATQTCLDAIAAGDGRDVFKFQGDQLVHVATGACVALAHADRGRVVLQDCGLASRAQDGRAAWELTADGQLKLARMGNYCLAVVDGHAAARDCGEAALAGDSSDKFVLSVVAELDLGAAVVAKDQAVLLGAAAKRQRGALNALQARLSTLGSCKFVASLVTLRGNRTIGWTPRHAEHVAFAAVGSKDVALDATGRIYAELGLDYAGVMRLIRDSSGALEAAEAKVTHSA